MIAFSTILILASAFSSEMKEASEYAAKKKAAQFSTLRLEQMGASVAARLELERYTYKVGQTWKVRTTLPVMSQALKEPLAPEQPATFQRVFEYKVVALERGVATVEIVPDDQPRTVRIKIDKRMRVLSGEGATQLGGLTQFPIAVPPFNDSEARERADGTIEYESEDSLSRPVRVVWRKGDPWPAEMTGAAGHAVLIEGGR